MKHLLHSFFWSFAHDRLHRLDAWLMKKIGQTPQLNGIEGIQLSNQSVIGLELDCSALGG